MGSLSSVKDLYFKPYLDPKTRVLFLIGYCDKCEQEIIIKFKKPGKFKCPHCKKEFKIIESLP